MQLDPAHQPSARLRSSTQTGVLQEALSRGRPIPNRWDTLEGFLMFDAEPLPNGGQVMYDYIDDSSRRS